MQIDVRIDGDEAVLSITGDLTLGHEGLLSEKVRALLGEGYRRFVLDLASMTYADSAGLGEIVQVHVMVRREGGVLRLERLNARVTDLLRITKLLTIFERDPQERIPDPPDPLNPRLRDIRWEFMVAVAATMLVIVGVMLLLK